MKDLEGAESWLDAAKFTLANTPKGRARFTVAVAQSIHALIKANDALSMRFLGRRSTRHEDAAAMFGTLIKQNKVHAVVSMFTEIFGDSPRIRGLQDVTIAPRRHGHHEK